MLSLPTKKVRKTRNRPHRFVLHMDYQAELGPCVHGTFSTLNSQLSTALLPCPLAHPFRRWASGRRSPAIGRCLGRGLRGASCASRSLLRDFCVPALLGTPPACPTRRFYAWGSFLVWFFL